MMKLWIVWTANNRSTLSSIICRAETEYDARGMANSCRGANINWHDPAIPFCEELKTDGERELICREENR